MTKDLKSIFNIFQSFNDNTIKSYEAGVKLYLDKLPQSLSQIEWKSLPPAEVRKRVYELRKSNGHDSLRDPLYIYYEGMISYVDALNRAINSVKKYEYEQFTENLARDWDAITKIVHQCSFEKNVLKIITHDIIVTSAGKNISANFGQFIITISEDSMKNHGAINGWRFTKHTKQNWVYAPSTAIHPHIHRKTICLGEGEGAFLLACQEGRIFDAIEIVLSVMSVCVKDHDRYWDLIVKKEIK